MWGRAELGWEAAPASGVESQIISPPTHPAGNLASSGAKSRKAPRIAGEVIPAQPIDFPPRHAFGPTLPPFSYNIPHSFGQPIPSDRTPLQTRVMASDSEPCNWPEPQKLWVMEVAGSSVCPKRLPAGDPSRTCVLSIDGGGMRGIIACHSLLYLQNALRRKTGDPEASIADYFDVAAGTNIGGVVAAMLFARDGSSGRPLCDAEQALQLLAEKGKKMFRGGLLARILRLLFDPTKYSAAGLERVLKGLFRSLTLRDTVKPVLIPCYDLSRGAPLVFSQADALHSRSYDFRLWEVCRATTASPGLFRPATLRSVDGRTACTAIDGGVVMNNPTAAAITHVLNNKREFPGARGLDRLLVLSLGTAGPFEGNYEYRSVKGWGLGQWARRLLGISAAGISDVVDHALCVAFGDHRQNYVRVQAAGRPSRRAAETDDPSRGNVMALRKLAEDTLQEKGTEYLPFGWKRILPRTNAERLDWFAEQLVAEHRHRRARKVYWKNGDDGLVEP